MTQIATCDGNILTIEGVKYRICRYSGDEIEEIVSTVRREGDGIGAALVCDMKLDAGGCGKDALKMHIGVPICYLLSHAQRVSD